MASSSKSKTGSSEMLCLADCMCPVCLCILIDPVTMPCNHELCMKCFKENVQQTSLCCPMCRLRISSWARKAARDNKLVDTRRWKEIREAFPDHVDKRMKGIDDEILEEEMYPITNVHLSEPGEIRQEYEKEMQKVREQLEKDRKREEEESAKVIHQLQEEEARLRQERELEAERQRLADEMLAQELSSKLHDNDKTPDMALLRQQCLQKLSKSLPNQTPTSRGIAKFLVPKTDHKGGGTRISESSDKYPYSCISPSDKPEYLDRVEVPMTPSRATTEPFCDSRASRLPDSRATIPYGVASCTIVKQELDQSFNSTLSDFSGLSKLDHSFKSVKKLDLSLGSDKSEKDDSIEIVRIESGSSKDETKSETPTTSCAAKRSRSAQSEDSISQELVHFRPIRACPKTPPRPTANGLLTEVPIVLCTPLNPRMYHSKTPETDEPSVLEPKANLGSPVVARSLLILSSERKAHVKALSKSTSTNSGKQGLKFTSPVQALTFDDDRPRLGNKKQLDLRNLNFAHNLNDSTESADSIIPLESNISDESCFEDFDPFREYNEDSNCEILLIPSPGNQKELKSATYSHSSGLNDERTSSKCSGSSSKFEGDIVRRTASSRRIGSSSNTPISISSGTTLSRLSTSKDSFEGVSDEWLNQEQSTRSISGSRKQTSSNKLKLKKVPSSGQNSITSYFGKVQVGGSESGSTKSVGAERKCVENNPRQMRSHRNQNVIASTEDIVGGTSIEDGGHEPTVSKIGHSLRNRFVEASDDDETTEESPVKTRSVHNSKKEKPTNCKAVQPSKKHSLRNRIGVSHAKSDISLRKRTVVSYNEIESDSTTDGSPVKRRTRKLRNRHMLGHKSTNSYDNSDSDETTEESPPKENVINTRRNRTTLSKTGSVDSDSDSDATNEESPSKKTCSVVNDRLGHVTHSRVSKRDHSSIVTKGKSLSKVQECVVNSVNEADDISVEERDRLLAAELQMQFDLEAKYRHINMLKTKGSSDEYNFRARKRNGNIIEMLGKKKKVKSK